MSWSGVVPLILLTPMTLVVVLILISYIYPELIFRLRRRSRLIALPLLGLTISLIRSKGWQGIEKVAQLADKGLADPMLVASLSALQKSCPNERTVELMTKLGLYEEIVRHAARGCRVRSDVLEKAREHFIVSGLPNWERAASQALGKESFYELISNSVIYAYCSKDRVWIKATGIHTELAGNRGISAYRDPREILWTILEVARPPLMVYLGRECPRPSGVRYVDLSHLFSIAFPDIEPDIISIAYHIGMNPKDPATVVEKAAKLARGVLDEVGVVWDKMPETVKNAYMIEPERPTRTPLGSEVVITDRPRLAFPLYKPYTVLPPTSGEEAEDWDYAAIVSLKALNKRWGDPSRAFSLKRGNPLDERLPGLIAGSLRVREEDPPRPVQVEPWYVLQISSKLENVRAILDCIRPPSRCLLFKELPEHERKLINVAGGLPGSEKPKTVRTLEVEVPYPLQVNSAPIKVLVNENLKKSFASVRFYLGDIPKDPCSLAKLSTLMFEGEKNLIVAPSEPLARHISRCLNIPLVDGRTIDHWFFDSRSSVAVTTYETLIRDFWILTAPNSIVSLLPERAVARYSTLGPAEDLFWETLWTINLLGGSTVSRAAKLMYQRGVISEAKIVTNRLKDSTSSHVDNIDVDDLISYSERVFKELWGEDLSLRGYQVDALYSLYSLTSPKTSGTLVVILPTGAGKSAIFQVASRVLSDLGLGSASLVISPLKALIHDQVKNALRRGLKVAYIDSSVPPKRRRELIDLALSGLLDLLYITPERFEDPEFESMVREGDMALVVLDEAHTLSRWGMSFRPSYLYMAKVISEVRNRRRDIPVLALTATAPPDIVDEIVEVIEGVRKDMKEVRIDLRTPPTRPEARPGEVLVLRAPPVRDEIRFDVRPGGFGEERVSDLARLLSDLVRWANSFGEPWVGLIYTGYVRSKKYTWANAEELAKTLSETLGEEVAFYHGKLSPSIRRNVERKVEESSRGLEGPRIIVATKAFGMGVDIPNIRFVVHLTPSDSIEDYYQEVGRAARDGKEAIAISYYNPEDFKIKERLKLREVIKPSDVLLLYNFIVLIAKHSKSGRRALVPLSALIKLLGSKERASRALETLRLSGILDYTVIEGNPVLGNDEDCYVRIGSACLTIGERNELNIGSLMFCVQKDSPIPLVAINIGGKVLGETCEETQRILFAKERYYYIELSPWIRHSPRLSLPPEVYLRTLMYSSLEISKLRELKELMEEALKAKSRGGQALADEVLRRGIERALEREVRKVRSAEEVLKKLGVKECDSLNTCLEEIWKVVSVLDENLGESSYVLAAAGSELSSILRHFIEQRIGRTIKDPAAEYRRLMSSARRGPHSVSNRGFVVLLVSTESRSMKIILEKLSDYPYKFVYVFSPRRKG